MILAVAGIFGLGQFIEGNLISPRLVGSRIHLHPVWMIFAVLAGTTLFGLLGTFLAVPFAAVLGVLIRFGLERYQNSALFAPPDDEDQKPRIDVAGPLEGERTPKTTDQQKTGTLG
jgi:predicted PurR-regulated permease PerM